MRPVAGDLIGIPTADHGFAPLLFLGLFGHFGHAFGLFRVGLPLSANPATWDPAGVVEHPVFAHDRELRRGRWPVLARRPDLVARFQAPELFHHPRSDPGDGSYGEFGLAESPSGQLRRLSREEASAVFVGPGGEFHQALLVDELLNLIAELQVPKPVFPSATRVPQAKRLGNKARTGGTYH